MMKQLFIILQNISILNCCLLVNLNPKPPQTTTPTGTGCPFNRDAAMFQQEETSHPIMNWGWSFMTDYQVVDDVVGLPHYNWFPDGHISTVQVTLDM